MVLVSAATQHIQPLGDTLAVRRPVRSLPRELAFHLQTELALVASRLVHLMAALAAATFTDVANLVG